MKYISSCLINKVTAVVIILLTGLFLWSPASALTSEELFSYWTARYASILPRPTNQTILDYQLAKATPDECFYDVGDPSNDFSYHPIFDPYNEECTNTLGTGVPPNTPQYGQPKVNQAYVWGMAKSGKDLWFGTMANTHCLVIGGYLGSTSPVLTDSFVCEFGENQFSSQLPDIIGDWRPPRIFVYHTETGTLEEKNTFNCSTSNSTAATVEQLERPPSAPCMMSTLGLRSGGSLGDIVFLGGPSLSFSGGVNLFAYNASGAYLGTTTIAYSNIRKWLAVDGVLYTAVGGGPTDGAVLKWVGTPEAPFSGGTNGFEVVGSLDSSGAELALHDGRIFVSTWPGGGELTGSGALAGIFMSPVVPDGGLPASTAPWQKVWSANDYEPDPVTAATYGGGALASFGGYLYWGTMNVPMLSTVAHIYFYGEPTTEEENLQSFLGPFRPISIFRGQNFGTPSQTVQLLYGLNEMPVYSGGEWTLMPNNMGGATPLYGQAGFDNFFNNYTWTMSIYRNQLFVGTMDFSYLLEEGGLGISLDIPLIEILLPSDPGADLMRFPSTSSAAIAESINGMGNQTTYGIRTMVSDDNLYLGMANPMNLHADGGWELLKLDPCFPFTDLDADGLCSNVDTCPNDPTNDADGDGTCEDVDNCPGTANASQTDSDSDGAGNECDVCPFDKNDDSDGDGVCGDVDNCPGTSNAGQTDSDNDGAGNDCDVCPFDANDDSDGDGVCGDIDNCPGTSNGKQTDSDSDGAGDACDACPNDADNDLDGDGVCGDVDSCPNDANNDSDSDGICGDVDNCPGSFNPGQENSDNDPLGDACDSCPNDSQNDRDNDGICGDVDPCPKDRRNDIDGDGFCSNRDNCPTTSNAEQSDTDMDGVGDACDLCPDDATNDADGDGICGNVDGCPNDADKTEPGTCGCGISDNDSDDDGTPDCNDNCPDDPEKLEPGSCGCGTSDNDSDGDGTLDCNDECPNDPNKTEPGTTGCDVPEGFIFPGTDVEVSACNDVNLTFAEISSGGLINCSESDESTPPANFMLLGQTVDLDFTGEFAGLVTVCFPYDDTMVEGAEENLQLLHLMDGAIEWQDITTSVDTEQNIICGAINSFSAFAVAEPQATSSSSGCFIATADHGSNLIGFRSLVSRFGPSLTLTALLSILALFLGFTYIAMRPNN